MIFRGTKQTAILSSLSQRSAFLCAVFCLAMLATACGSKSVSSGGTTGTNPAPPSSAAFPLKVSSNGRYLIDQNNVPFLMLGDSPQSMIVNLRTTDMATYMANRQARGFNTIIVDVLVTTYTARNASGTTFDGIAPFTIGTSPSDYDLSTPNSAYFARLDALVSMAASHGLLVALDPIETGGWLPTLENNGTTKSFNYGAFLGSRYKNSPNVIWQSGNDFQDWSTNSTDNNLVHQVMAGIASTAPTQLQTIELDFFESYSNQDHTTLGSTLTLDAAYTYFETYDEVLAAYNSTPTLPVFLVEANYEFENDLSAFPGVTDTFILREQEYWTMTSGASGQFYGSLYTWKFAAGWQNHLDSPGALELSYLTRLFNSIPWWNLVPDQTHQVVTIGYGTYNAGNDDLPLANYATTAWVPDGSVAIGLRRRGQRPHGQSGGVQQTSHGRMVRPKQRQLQRHLWLPVHELRDATVHAARSKPRGRIGLGIGLGSKPSHPLNDFRRFQRRSNNNHLRDATRLILSEG